MTRESLTNWLALREAADAAARSIVVTTAVAGRLAGERPVRVLDLGTGTGANLRHLIPHFGARQHWLLVDRDAEVLSALPARMSEWSADCGYAIAIDATGLTVSSHNLNCRIEIRHQNLRTLDDAAIFSDRDLVTASALLDRVSDAWLRDLAARCRQDEAVALFALTYDGRSRCSPGEPEDKLIVDLLNCHQKQYDTGFGTAAGPDASQSAATAFAAVGYQVQRQTSDWVLSAQSGAMQRELFRGWADAALEVAPERSRSIRAWLARRLAHVDRNRSTVIVGHQDLAAWR